MMLRDWNMGRLGVLWLVLALLMVLVGSGSTQAEPTFRLGVLGGEDSRVARGAQLVVNQINQAGGVEGADGTRFRLELVYVPFEDVEAAVAQLRSSEIVAVIGPSTAAQAAAVVPLANTLNVPLLTLAADDRSIIEDTTNRLFRVRASSFFTEQALADYLFEETDGGSVTVIQFDVDATIATLGFVNAYQGSVTSPILVNSDSLVDTTVALVMENNPAAVVTYGRADRASGFYTSLREAGYDGLFTHPQATLQQFRRDLTADTFAGIISSTSWTPAAVSQASDTFVLAYVRTFGELPDADAAAGADAALLVAEAIEMPGELYQNLASLDGVVGVQGVLSPTSLDAGELSDNVYIVRLNDFGVPTLLAQYRSNERLEIETPSIVLEAGEPEPTATPDGVVVTIVNPVQNVRSGPSTDFNVLGQLQEGQQVDVIGATADYDWLVISFRGQQGWIANLSSLNEVFGDLNMVPLVTPPPTPTPAVLPTATAAPQADIVIQSAAVSPNPISAGRSFTLAVTVGNVGRAAAGPFAIGTTLNPGNVFLSENLEGLAAGQSTTVNLTGTLNQSGNYSAVIVADLNNQVDEGAGEANNNTFVFNYQVQAGGLSQTLPESGERIFSPGDALTLATGLRIVWDGDAIVAQGEAQVGRINGADFETIGKNSITDDIVNQDSVNPDEGDVIGVLGDVPTAAALSVVSLDDDQATIAFKVFE